ncbi:MAG: AbrB/MazE/SpoVT family DNA-binding domain-containing protein [Gammaproteobacteria bacterium]|nr:MAG: AbrB/MazE/SpoVT family DNA-binding domain-containing protein [Gammaproteobacteria bacterium]
MHKARLFINGRSQAVRIPKDLAFEGIGEVAIHKEGKRLILEPIRKTWTSLSEIDLAGDDFMAERPEILQTDRVKF